MSEEYNTEYTESCPDCIISHAMLGLISDHEYVAEIDLEGLDFVLKLNAGDVFHYATGDSEPVRKDQVVEVYNIYLKQGVYGLIAWIAEQRGMKPVVEYCEKLSKAGISLSESLKDNPENLDGKRW